MKKTGLVLMALCITAFTLSAQTTFDVFTFKEPKGYTKQTGNGFISYLKYNKAKTGFCNIGIYGAVQNSGALQQVFNKDWNDLVVKPYKPTAQPQTELARDINGWKVMSGYAPYTADGTQRAAMLYTFAKNDMAADIVIATNSNEFEADITALINSLKLGGAAATNNTTVTNTNSGSPTSIIGEWSNNDILIANYVNTSGGYVGDASSASNTSYKFNSNGTYESFFAYTQGYKTQTFYDKGKYIINGNTITITPTTQVYKLNTKVQPTDAKALKIKKLNYKFEYNEDRKKWYLQLEGIGNDYTGRDVLYNVAGANNNTTNTNPTTPSTNSNSKFGGGITGIWLCYTNNFPFSTDMIWKRRIFFNDGTFLQGHPYFGLINFKEDENNELGTYKINGNSGSINMKAWSSPTAFTLIKPNQLKIGNDVYYKSDDVNEKTFSGSYTSYDFSLFSEVAQQPVNNRSLIHFYRNGTFLDEGIYQKFLGSSSYTGADDSPGKGTYSIKEYTITFKYDDGRTRTSAISTAFSSKLQDCKFLSLSNGILNKYK